MVLARELGGGLFRNSLTNLQLGIGSGPWLRAQVELTVDSLLIQVPLFHLLLLLPEDVVQREKAEPPVLIKTPGCPPLLLHVGQDNCPGKRATSLWDVAFCAERGDGWQTYLIICHSYPSG